MLWKKTRHDGIDVAFIGGCSRSADALEGRAPLSKAKDVAPQSSATFALSARCEARGMPRELVNTVLERFDKAALELKAVVGLRFEIDQNALRRFTTVASPLEKVTFR
jgi:hypothetical protein